MQESSYITSSDLVDIPPDYLCCITGELMMDPVVAADGHSYERSAIQQWINLGHHTSPMTNARLAHTILTPNHNLRKTIEDFREKLPEIQRRKLTLHDIEIAIKLREENLQFIIEKQQQQLAAEKEKNSVLQQELESERSKNVRLFSTSPLNNNASETTHLQLGRKSPTLFQPPQSPLSKISDLPTELIEGLMLGTFNVELMDKKLILNYVSKKSLLTEKKFSKEAENIFKDLQEALQKSKISSLITTCTYSLEGNVLRIITQFEDDALELKEYLEESSLLTNMNDKPPFKVSGQVSVVAVKNNQLEIQYTMKENVFTEEEFDNKVAKLFAELKQYFNKAGKNNLIVHYSNSSKKNVLSIETQFTDDALELQEFLEESGILRSFTK